MRNPASLMLVMALFSLADCATPPPASDPEAVADFKQTNDPLEPTNRVLYNINQGIDAVVLRPLAEGYRYALPQPVRNATHNALDNLAQPVVISNHILQGNPRRAGDELMRFVINSTLGLGGFFDPATRLGYPAHSTDFGITLAEWGVGEGPYLYLPIIGPSGPRDALGFGIDTAMDPFTWVGQGAVVTDLEYVRYGLFAIDERERALDDLDAIMKNALDPYATLRSLYRQHRQSKVVAASSDEPATVPAWFPQPEKASPKP